MKHDQPNDRTEQQQLLRIPTDWRQISWLFTIVPPRIWTRDYADKNSMSGQNRSCTAQALDLKASILTTGPHCLFNFNFVSWLIYFRAAFMTKMMLVGDQAFKFNIWDTAGQERVRRFKWLTCPELEIKLDIFCKIIVCHQVQLKKILL